MEGGGRGQRGGWGTGQGGEEGGRAGQDREGEGRAQQGGCRSAGLGVRERMLMHLTKKC